MCLNIYNAYILCIYIYIYIILISHSALLANCQHHYHANAVGRKSGGFRAAVGLRPARPQKSVNHVTQVVHQPGRRAPGQAGSATLKMDAVAGGWHGLVLCLIQ